MATDWRSDWRNAVIDLSVSSDEDEGGTSSVATREVVPKTAAPLLAKPTSSPIPRAMPTPSIPTSPAQPRYTYIPVPEPKPRKFLSVTGSSHVPKRRPTPPIATASRGGAVNPAKEGSSVPLGGLHPPKHVNEHVVAKNMHSVDREAKRRKLSDAGGPTQVQGPPNKPKTPTASVVPLPRSINTGSVSHGRAGSTVSARPTAAPSRLADKSVFVNTGKKSPSVQCMNAALKTNGSSTTSLLDKVASSGPRPVQIGRSGDNRSLSTPEPKSTTPLKQASITSAQSTTRAHDSSRDAIKLQNTRGVARDLQGAIASQHPHIGTPDITTVQARTTRFKSPNGSLELLSFSGPMQVEDDDKEGVLSDASSPADRTELKTPSQPTSESRRRLPVRSPPGMADQHTMPLKSNATFTEEEDHLLIFLKEVKRLKWKLITAEFQRFYPTRLYHTIQWRYTAKMNKRDRSQDPAVLKLPPEWAGEAVIDWPSVHADTSGPRECVEIASLHRDVNMLKAHASKPTTSRHCTEPDYSSGTDSGISKRRPRRAAPVNYDVRKHKNRLENDIDATNLGESLVGGLARKETPTQAEFPAANTQSVVLQQIQIVVNEPLDVDFTMDDARIALNAVQRKRVPLSQKLPYIEASERLSLQNCPANWEWNQNSSRDWQGTLLHVDFSPAEAVQLERAIVEDSQTAKKPRHTTQRRHLRTLLKGITEPGLLKLAHSLRVCLPARERAGIEAFLRDAKSGKVADDPHILRLSAARSKKMMSTVQRVSTSCMLRQRELGLQSRRGWSAATKASTYQIRNKIMDTLGPSTSWTGASSDIHTVAWSPDGEQFAAGAVAVTDHDSMQYNRPNNLLFGDLTDNSIHELAEHSITRKRTETGANSSHAMFVSQDPNLYTTVTSVAFAPSGKVMYSAGYDRSVCIWGLGAASTQPYLTTKIIHKAEVEMMVVNRSRPGIVATAAKRTSGSAVKLIFFDEDNPYEFDKHDFHSEKAQSRSDLNILPQALQFEPRYGELLLAGFGANARTDQGLDVTGDLCLWDITTQTQIAIHGSNRNTFDVVFNPNRRYLPLFAAGCVAGGSVNRGTRSVIRLYDERGPARFTCPLEIECRALDMNDIVWSSQNENLMAAGCTDGRAYVWDLRNSNDPLRVLSHGTSLLPLPEDVHHERTDTGIRFLSWGDNATRLYSGSSDGVVKVWDVTRSEEDTFVKDLITFDSGIMAGSFSPDHSKLVIGEVNGSVDVLNVGRDDYTIKDAGRLHYIPYQEDAPSEHDYHGSLPDNATTHESAADEGNSLLETGQLLLAPMGNLPTLQVVQGPNYAGPFDHGVDAPFLREQALAFQMSMVSKPGPQCSIPSCKDNMVKITSEEIGDSGRSRDRIPDELRRQWTAIESGTRIMPGKSKCTHCTRPGRPSPSGDPNDPVLCERCSFACFRCAAVNAITPATTTVTCDSCAGVWDIGALGYDCLQDPVFKAEQTDVPPLRRYGTEVLEGIILEDKMSYGDDMNALTDHYFSLAIDRPESPPPL